jgi:hypothetical protein
MPYIGVGISRNRNLITETATRSTENRALLIFLFPTFDEADLVFTSALFIQRKNTTYHKAARIMNTTEQVSIEVTLGTRPRHSSSG